MFHHGPSFSLSTAPTQALSLCTPLTLLPEMTPPDIPESRHLWLQTLTFRLSNLAVFKSHFNMITFSFFSFKKCPHITYYFILLFSCLCSACASLCTRYLQCQWSPEEGIRSPRTGVTHGCERPCRSWELNSGPLERPPVLLAAEYYLYYTTPH